MASRPAGIAAIRHMCFRNQAPLVKFNPMKYRIPLLKRAVPSIKKRIAKATWRRGYAIKGSNGALFLLNYRNFVDRQIAFYDDFEVAQRRYLFASMAEHGCDLFLDVGANIGFYSVLVANGGLADRVVAFEPDARNRLQMGANLLMNGLVSKVEIVPKAVTEESGIVDFLPSPDTSTGQSKVGQGIGAIRVEAICLDDFIDESGLRVFIKMDIEGHELEAVRGMGRLLRNNRTFMQIESFPENLARLTESLSECGLAHCNRIEDDHYFRNF